MNLGAWVAVAVALFIAIYSRNKAANKNNNEKKK